MTTFNIILFDGFETLDAFGPAEVIGRLSEHYRLDYYSLHGGLITSFQHVRVMTLPFSEMNTSGVILIPGGMGTRKLVNEADWINAIKEISIQASYVLTVCTGSALLAKTGLLKGKRATTNKLAFDWVAGLDKEVLWQRKARWVDDGKYYTSSGISAGIDMALGFTSDLHGRDTAEEAARRMEYCWNDDPSNDPFTFISK